jgi:hypothetical protein
MIRRVAKARNWRHRVPMSQEQMRVLQEQVQVLKASRQRVPGQHRLQEPIPEQALGAPQRQVRS